MPKKGELSKTARASLANRSVVNHATNHICPTFLGFILKKRNKQALDIGACFFFSE